MKLSQKKFHQMPIHVLKIPPRARNSLAWAH